MSDPHDSIYSTSTKEKKMKVPFGFAPEVGQVITSRVSGKVGTVLQVVPHTSKDGKVTYRTELQIDGLPPSLSVWTSF